MILAVLFPTWHELLNPLSGNGYQWWSGVGSDFGEATLITGLVATAVGWYVHHQCHVEAPRNCRRIGHRVPGTAHFACREHHPHGEVKGAVTVEDILRHHEESNA